MDNQDNKTPPDLLRELLGRVIEERQRRIGDHAALRASQPYQAAVEQLDRLVADYGLAVNAFDFMATRYPPFFDTLITLRVKPHLIESLVAAIGMAKEGMLNPARRELRFLLEASVKALWLDTGALRTGDEGEDRSGIGQRRDVGGKVAALDELGRERFKEIVKHLKLKLLLDDAAQTYVQTATSLYSKLSTHIHLSTQNLKRDFANFDCHRPLGFETVADVCGIAGLAERVVDLALASHFEAFDAGFVGDILVKVFDDNPRWTFRTTPLVGAIDHYFDYKAERRDR